MAYGQMAFVYDLLMEHAPYENWVDFAEKMFRLMEQPVERVVDLGCGTGEITLRLAKRGYEIVGVDHSESMLALAAEKAYSQQAAINWLHQDIRNLDGLHGFDAAISFCDVVNYITEPEEIGKAFKNVYDVLKPGGLFLFDVHHLPHVTEHYMGETFAEVTDEASYIWFCTPGEKSGEMYHELTFFQLVDGKYERFDEEHHQRTFPVDFYKRSLEESGFDNINVYADFSHESYRVQEDAERIFFAASKSRDD